MAGPTSEKLKYEEVFTPGFRWRQHCLHLLLLIVLGIRVIIYIAPNGIESDDWSQPGKWLVGITFVPFIPLLGACIWARSKVNEAPKPYCNLWLMPKLCSTSLVSAAFFLAWYEISEITWGALLGFFLAVYALVTMIITVIIVERVWTMWLK